jgi:biopolymer transport protein ExbD
MALDSGFDSRGARIEMIPLMDVVFLLLVFFIYAMFSMSVHRGVRVDLPRVAGAAESGDRIVITLTADNRIELNGTPAALDDAVVGAVELWRERATPVLISADRKADIGPGIELLSKLKNGGVEAVAFQVEAR